MSAREQQNLRVLVIDDTRALHEDFRKLLCGGRKAAEIDEIEAALFGPPAQSIEAIDFDVDFAFQGREGFELVQAALLEQRPFALAFVDMRMPPGWDGLETVQALWRVDADLEVVICTAYSDYTEDEMLARLGSSDQLLILKKPFDAIEVRQIARALTAKRSLRRQTRLRLAELERQVTISVVELSRCLDRVRSSDAEDVEALWRDLAAVKESL